MKYLISLILIVTFIASGLFLFSNYKKYSRVTDTNSSTTVDINSKGTNSTDTAPKVVAKNLNTPWAIAFLPDGRLLITERPGRVRLVNKDGSLLSEALLTLDVVQKIQGEGGLHGIAIHPEFQTNSFVYLYYTYENQGNQSLNRVSRYKLGQNILTEEKVIVDKIPGALFHDGGRIKFGPDSFLYITTGDAQDPSLAQNKNSLAGKILRVNDNGQVVADNPFGTLVYSYGHRNPQGITWDESGRLWETEHGQSATDEVNLIESGKNYGWPTIRGDDTKNGLISPIAQSGSNTWAPGGAAYLNGSLFFAGLRGQALYEAVINGRQVVEVKEHFKNQFGRIRDVVLGPDSMLYISTSNKDGRGSPTSDDDIILKINPKNL